MLLFSEKKETSLLYKKLSVDFHRAALLGEVHSSDAALVKRYGVTTFPSIYVSGVGPHDADAEAFLWSKFEGRAHLTMVMTAQYSFGC